MDNEVIFLTRKIVEKTKRGKEEITDPVILRERIAAMLQGIHSPALLERIYWFVDRIMSD